MSRRLIAGAIAAAALLGAALFGIARLSDKERPAPYVPTPQQLADEMLRLARVGPEDFVVDLGSGDGRLVITAAKQFGARGYGVEINERLVDLANHNAALEGVAGRAKFYKRDLFTADLSEASVVTIYLLPWMLKQLEPKLIAELEPGARIVTHDYALPTLRHERAVSVQAWEKSDATGGAASTLFLYVIPARAEKR